LGGGSKGYWNMSFLGRVGFTDAASDIRPSLVLHTSDKGDSGVTRISTKQTIRKRDAYYSNAIIQVVSCFIYIILP